MIDGWMDKKKIVVCISHVYVHCVCICMHNGTWFSHKKKKKEILPFTATWMDLKGIMLHAVSQKENDKNNTISLTCDSKADRQTNHHHQQQNQVYRHREQTSGCQMHRVINKWDKWEVSEGGINVFKKQTNKKPLLKALLYLVC